MAGPTPGKKRGVWAQSGRCGVRPAPTYILAGPKQGAKVSDKLKILIVEDDAMIAMEMGERLIDLGFEVVGPALSVDAAQSMLAAGLRPDAALLDANIAGESSVPVGAELAARGVPVAFCTGYDRIKNLPPELEAAPVLIKPVGEAELAAGLKRLLNY